MQCAVEVEHEGGPIIHGVHVPDLSGLRLAPPGTETQLLHTGTR